MADPANDPGIISIRSILGNIDYLSNWITAVVVAGNFSVLISLKDKLTGAAIAISFWTSISMAMVGWPLLLQYGYGGLGMALGFGMLCGVAGMLILMTLIGVITRVYRRKEDIADNLLSKGGIPVPKKGSEAAE